MASSELLTNPGPEPAATSPEVEFALVLSRMIHSVQDSPADLRQAIYELARYKLQEQFADTPAREVARTQQALETAIQGVEAFSGKSDRGIFKDAPRPAELGAPRAPMLAAHVREIDNSLRAAQPAAAAMSTSPQPRRAQGAYLPRSFAVLAVIVVAAIAVQQRERWLGRKDAPAAAASRPAPREPVKETVKETVTAPVAALPAAAVPLPAKPDPLIPTNYGVYAVADGQLVELQPLPGRVPDARVAVSSAIQARPGSVLPNGTPRFIVFRRDAATTAADRPEVRIVARIARDFSGDGQKGSESGDTWVMRNISFGLRAGPMDGKPDMYEIRSGDGDAALSPGRYALVLKGQAYDFSIAGKPSDPRQCLERVSGANGTFYSECSKP